VSQAAPAGASAPVAARTSERETTRRSRAVGLLVICGLSLAAVIAAATAVMVIDLRERSLAASERELKNTALVLAEQTDRAFHAVEVVQTSLIERLRQLGIRSSEDHEREMSGHDVHLMLKDRIGGLAYLEAVAVISARGKLLNFSRSWPIPDIDVSDRDYFKALQSDPQLMSFVSEPVRSRATGTWTFYLARKLAGPNGELVGLVLGAVAPQYFEKFFKAIALGDDSSISLVRRDGMLLVREPPVKAHSPGLSYAKGDLFTKVLSHADSGAVRLVSIIDGTVRQVAGHALAHYPLVTVVTRTEAAALAEWRSAALYIAGAAGLLLLVIGVIVRLSIRQIRSYEALVKARAENDQKVQLDAALNNMRQGLVMFDSGGRLVLYNQRFLQMYGLSPEAVKPGLTLSGLLRLRKAAGTFKGDPDRYIAKLVDADGAFKGDPDRQVAELFEDGRVETKAMELPDGRTISIVNQSIPGSGWVSMHEDITERRRAEEERDRNREFLDLIIENVPVPVFVKDARDRRYVLINRAAEKFWGIVRDEMIGRVASDMFSKQDADLIAARDDELVRSGELDYAEREMHTPRNGIRYASSKRLTISDRDGNPKYLIGVLEDATERRRLEGERDRSQTFLNTIIENVPVTIFAKEAREHRYVLVNRAAEELWGLPRKDVIGKTAHDLFPERTADVIFEHDLELLAHPGQLFHTTHGVETPNNGAHLVESRRIALVGADGKPEYLLGVVEDVTERAQADERMRYLAHHDLLTGLCNRALFMEKIEEAGARLRRRNETFTIFMLDLDRFKNVNDSLGHPEGDILLKETARRLKSALRETDVLARLGGDEFAILQAGEADQRLAATALADRIIDLVREPYEINGSKVSIGASIGVALAPADGIEPSDLMKKADLALYRAKSEGRDGYRFFDAQMTAAADARHQLEHDLREAISRNELEVHYQPIIDVKTRKPLGAEALVRWRHPQRGYIPPDQFIPLAEETGLIIPLGERVLQKACSDAACWPPHLKVAVNLSIVQFRKCNLLDVILCTLVESGLAPDRLELEITESILIENELNILAVVRQLKNLGVALVLDDFGTGYSSLSYLTKFPFDKIKIDKSFTQNLTKRAECAAIIASVRALGYSLDITTTAEGVETEQQFEMLRATGINTVQGYLFGRPCPVSELSFASDAADSGAERAA